MRARSMLFLAMFSVLLIGVIYGMAPGALSRTSPNNPQINRPNATFDVSITDFQFQPADLTIHVGDTVTWTNNGPSDHTTTSDTLVWDSGTLIPGNTFSFTFTQTGVFPYHCSIHSIMHGTITVIDLSTPLPTNTPTVTRTPTHTPTATNTSTEVIGPTLTNTPTLTLGPSLTPTNSETPTLTPTVNPLATHHTYLPLGMKSP